MSNTEDYQNIKASNKKTLFLNLIPQETCKFYFLQCLFYKNLKENDPIVSIKDEKNKLLCDNMFRWCVRNEKFYK